MCCGFLGHSLENAASTGASCVRPILDSACSLGPLGRLLLSWGLPSAEPLWLAAPHSPMSHGSCIAVASSLQWKGCVHFAAHETLLAGGESQCTSRFLHSCVVCARHARARVCACTRGIFLWRWIEEALHLRCSLHTHLRTQEDTNAPCLAVDLNVQAKGLQATSHLLACWFTSYPCIPNAKDLGF